jgi:hypothetical protein
MTDPYKWADYAFNSCPEYSMGFAELLSTSPYFVSPDVMKQFEERLAVIRKFQESVITLFRDVLFKERKGQILKWLINETPVSIGIGYHRALNDCHYTLPVFFRTDEVAPGRIAEIQCPGSLWGELQLTFNYAKKLGYIGNEYSPADKYVGQLCDYLEESPVVLHLLDSSSAPAGMRYFIECTRPAIKYWGIDKGIKPKNCNFIRSHSFFGLCAENEFRLRLPNIGKDVKYDLPPHVLFDQKAPLVLPFWSLTHDFFTDEIRNIFLYSTPLLPSGIELPDKTKISVSEFSKLPQSKRKYYLKYAGTDVSINWGAKAVFRLKKMSSMECQAILDKCLLEFNKGRIWLLQEEEVQDDEISYSDRSNAIRTEKLRAKISAFYGPQSCIGVIAMHRRFNKVHGQEDTVLSYVMPRKERLIN